MYAVESETVIDRSGHVQLPEQYRQLYGKAARVLVLIADEDPTMSVSRLSEPALEKRWNNPDGAVYEQNAPLTVENGFVWEEISRFTVG